MVIPINSVFPISSRKAMVAPEIFPSTISVEFLSECCWEGRRGGSHADAGGIGMEKLQGQQGDRNGRFSIRKGSEIPWIFWWFSMISFGFPKTTGFFFFCCGKSKVGPRHENHFSIWNFKKTYKKLIQIYVYILYHHQHPHISVSIPVWAIIMPWLGHYLAITRPLISQVIAISSLSTMAISQYFYHHSPLNIIKPWLYPSTWTAVLAKSCITNQI